MTTATRQPMPGVCWYCSRPLLTRSACTRSLTCRPGETLRTAHAAYPDGWLGTKSPRPWENHEQAGEIDAFLFQDFTLWPELAIRELSVDNWTIRPARIDHGRFWIIESRNHLVGTVTEFPFALPTAENAETNARDIGNWIETAMELNNPLDLDGMLARFRRDFDAVPPLTRRERRQRQREA